MATRIALLAAAARVAAAPPAVPPWDAALRVVPPALAARFGAACLDGTPPAYYFRPAATPTAARKFKLHIMGGGWCTTPDECLARSLLPVVGSSAALPGALSAVTPGGWPTSAAFYGLMDRNATSAFSDFAFAWLIYCDGSSFTSARDEPLLVNGTRVHMRGHANLDAILAALDAEAGFFSAAEVVLSGTSAGGLATYLHASYVKSLLTRLGARLWAVPDAGFFLDSGLASNASDHAYAATLAPMWALFNGTLGPAGAGARCLAAAAPGAAARCFLAQVMYPFITDVDGIFVINSLVDPSQLRLCFGLSCLLGSTCTPAEEAAIQGYALALSAAIQAAAARFGDRDAFFLTTCAHHEQSCRYEDWYGVRIGGSSPNASFASFAAGAGARASRVDVPWPGDASCWDSAALHGGC